MVDATGLHVGPARTRFNASCDILVMPQYYLGQPTGCPLLRSRQTQASYHLVEDESQLGYVLAVTSSYPHLEIFGPDTSGICMDAPPWARDYTVPPSRFGELQ